MEIIIRYLIPLSILTIFLVRGLQRLHKLTSIAAAPNDKKTTDTFILLRQAFL